MSFFPRILWAPSPYRAKVSAGHCGWGVLQEEEVQSQHTFWKSLQCCEYVLLVDSVFPEVKSFTKFVSASTFFVRLSSKFWAINLQNLQWSWWFILLLPCVQFSIGHQCGENSLHLKYSFREKKRKAFWLPFHCVRFSLAIDQRMWHFPAYHSHFLSVPFQAPRVSVHMDTVSLTDVDAGPPPCL